MSRSSAIVASVALLLAAVVLAGCTVHPASNARPPERSGAQASAKAVSPSAQDAKLWEKPGTKVGDEITGPDGGKMVWVPAGEFTMGTPEGDGDEDEHPAHRVRITKGFWLGKCTVPRGQWKSYCRAVGINIEDASALEDDHPVDSVSWINAVAYCKHYGLDLPTEAQWEYAARGPEGRKYPWGNEWDPTRCSNNSNQGSGGRGFPVGSFPKGASWCGALDMVGNVWQWCQDWYSQTYYANSPATDPPGPDKGSAISYGGPHLVPLYDEYHDDRFQDRFQERLLRGGTWFSDPARCRSAVRDHCIRDHSRDSGFRCSFTPYSLSHSGR